MYPKLMEHEGIPVPALMDRLIALALETIPSENVPFTKYASAEPKKAGITLVPESTATATFIDEGKPKIFPKLAANAAAADKTAISTFVLPEV